MAFAVVAIAGALVVSFDQFIPYTLAQSRGTSTLQQMQSQTQTLLQSSMAVQAVAISGCPECIPYDATKRHVHIESCNGETCTFPQFLEKIWDFSSRPELFQKYGINPDKLFHGGIAKQISLIVRTTMNTHTQIFRSENSVRPGSSFCLETRSDGEVAGYGVPYFLTPPMYFDADGTVRAVVGPLIIKEGDAHPVNRLYADFPRAIPMLTDEGIDLEHAEARAKWTDVWQTSSPAVQCTTRGMRGVCAIQDSQPSGNVQINLHRRIILPFTLFGQVANQEYMQVRPWDKVPVVMLAGVSVTIDPSAPSTTCDEPGDPQPSLTTTPTPETQTTVLPQESPMYAPPPSPQEGKGDGPPMFQQDVL